MTRPIRIVVYAKDIQILTGCSIRKAQIILSKIRERFNKSKDDFVTVIELCTYCKLDENLVMRALGQEV